jgi:hypothetical protein
VRGRRDVTSRLRCREGPVTGGPAPATGSRSSRRLINALFLVGLTYRVTRVSRTAIVTGGPLCLDCRSICLAGLWHFSAIQILCHPGPVESFRHQRHGALSHSGRLSVWPRRASRSLRQRSRRKAGRIVGMRGHRGYLACRIESVDRHDMGEPLAQSGRCRRHYPVKRMALANRSTHRQGATGLTPPGVR